MLGVLMKTNDKKKLLTFNILSKISFIETDSMSNNLHVTFLA